jgi:hypothetical protein
MYLYYYCSNRKFSRFLDAYRQELDGAWSAWTVQTYCGHQVLPTSLMQDFRQRESESSHLTRIGRRLNIRMSQVTQFTWCGMMMMNLHFYTATCS